MSNTLKVIQTSLESLEGRYILVNNINVPADMLGDLSINTRIENFIRQEYPTDNKIEFEISASYELVHKDTQESRIWTGSFNPRLDFQIFPKQDYKQPTFQLYMQTYFKRSVIFERLLSFSNDTKWVIHQLISAILVVQSEIFPGETRRRTRYHGGKRRVQTFDLP
jgi:hypothetical protein